VVGYKQRIGSVLNGNNRILLAHDPLGNDGQPTHLLDVFNHFPPNLVVLVVASIFSQPAVLLAALHIPLFSMRLHVLRIYRQINPLWKLEIVPDIILSFAENLGVNGESQSFKASLFGSSPDVPVHLVLFGKVNLEDFERVWGYLGHFLQWSRRP
jgi:hypothetical protein